MAQGSTFFLRPSVLHATFLNNLLEKRTNKTAFKTVTFQTQKYNTPAGLWRTARRRGRVVQELTQTIIFAQMTGLLRVFQGIEDTLLGSPPRRMTMCNSLETDGITKPSIDKRFLTCRTQNPDIPQAGRVGAPGGAAGRGRARLGANRTIRPGNKGPPYPPRHRRNVASTSLQKHE